MQRRYRDIVIPHVALLILTFAVIGMVCMFNELTAQQPPRQGPPPVQQQQGRVVLHNRDALQKPAQPMPKPPGNQPNAPQREGFHLGWHGDYHRWFYVPNTVVLLPGNVIPATYQLPVEVAYYEQGVATCRCPHCGWELELVAK
jgi:hypothetical protein